MIETWRAARTDERQLAWVGFAAAVLSLALSPVAATAARLAPPCLLRAWTGIPCPTCGSIRAVLAIARFEWLEAIRVNPLAAVGVVGLLAAGFAAHCLDRRRGKDARAHAPRATGRLLGDRGRGRGALGLSRALGHLKAPNQDLLERLDALPFKMRKTPSWIRNKAAQ